MKKKIRVLIAKPGLDGHDTGAKVIARALMDSGMEVIYTGLHQRIQAIVQAAIQEDVDCIGLSILSGAHLAICEKLVRELWAKKAEEVLLIVGGNIPKQDHQALRDLGVSQVFATGSSLFSVINYIRQTCLGPSFGEEDTKTQIKRIAPSAELEEVVLESGIAVKPVYTAQDLQQDLQGGDLEKEIGQPGQYPFVRGIHPQMYRKRPWTMRQYAGFATAEESNERFRYLIDNGQTGLNVAFDLPTQMGLDSDDPFAQGEVGRVGMAVDTLEDFEIAFDSIPLHKISTSLTINSVSTIMIAMYLLVAKKRGIPQDQIRGTAQNDILKEYIGRGTWIFPVEPSIKLIGDTVEYCARHMPRYYPVSICGYHIRESGANPVQEMAYAFSIAGAYIDHCLGRGLKVDDFASRLSFNFDIYGNLFEQVAKFRAGRKVWARLLKENYQAENPKSMQLKMIAGGGGGGLTIEQPENNIVRGAYYALISALSGTQTMALCSYDEAYTIPTEKAALISLRTMQILADEMGLRDTVDPLAGSYYVESLTLEMEKLIGQEMASVEQAGGIVKAIESGYIQNEVSKQAYLREKKMHQGEIIKVGVNKYHTEEEEREVALHQYDEEQAKRQIKRLNQIKEKRDSTRVAGALEALEGAARKGENLMPSIMSALQVYATVGEITRVLKNVYGEFREPVCL